MNLKPQLAEDINPSDLPRYCADENWVFQQKVDGHRRLIEVEYILGGLVITPHNKTGDPTDLPANVVKDFGRPEGCWVFDGELLGRDLWIFDLVQAGNGVELMLRPEDEYAKRHNVLEQLWPRFGFGPSIHLLPTAITQEEKADLAHRLLASDCEGVILRRLDGRYRFGQRGRELLRAKFCQTIHVVVMEVGRKGKASLGVGLYDETGTLVEVGAVTVNNRSLMEAKVNDVIEIRYLYAGANGRLVQPAGGRIVPDVRPEDCTTDKRKFTNKEVLA